ncbi:MAG TPA: hypothetical protein VFX03_06450, partial [Thermomicrobiales bacterium]|nr:hypothetical protein [Thermomicrobiales bacterium]
NADALLLGGLAATVLANLGLLRMVFGLRLFSVLGPASDAEPTKRRVPLDADLAYLVEAWPRLPEELRSDLLQQARSAIAPSSRQESLEHCAEAAERV